MRATSAGFVTLALISAAYAQESNADLVAKLRAAPANTDRIALLTDNQYVFDFLNPTSGITTGSAGHTVSANSENYPAVIGNGVAMTIGFLGPCGLNTPHTHPRATEINFAVNATLRTGFLAENGARFVFNDVPAGSVTIFPQGVIHFEQNQGCEPAMFVAAFNHEDPGVDQIAQRYFGLPPDVVGATLGGLGVEEVAGLEAKIPNNVAYGTDECLKRCGLTRPDPQLTSQRQPRNDGNVLPAGFSGPPAPSSTPAKAATAPPASTATTGSKAAIKDMHGGGSGVKSAAGIKAEGAASSGSSNGTDFTPFLIALVVVNALFLIGAGVGLFFFLKNRRNPKSNFDSHKYILTPGAERTPMYESGGSGTPKKSEYYDPYPAAPPAFKHDNEE